MSSRFTSGGAAPKQNQERFQQETRNSRKSWEYSIKRILFFMCHFMISLFFLFYFILFYFFPCSILWFSSFCTLIWLFLPVMFNILVPLYLKSECLCYLNLCIFNLKTAFSSFCILEFYHSRFVMLCAYTVTYFYRFSNSHTLKDMRIDHICILGIRRLELACNWD